MECGGGALSSEGKARSLGCRLLPVHLKEPTDFGEGLKIDRPPPCRVHELHPHGAELLVPDIESIELRDGEAAERHRLVRRVLTEVHPEQVEDVENLSSSGKGRSRSGRKSKRLLPDSEADSRQGTRD
jgi:hypothetical protein